MYAVICFLYITLNCYSQMSFVILPKDTNSYLVKLSIIDNFDDFQNEIKEKSKNSIDFYCNDNEFTVKLNDTILSQNNIIMLTVSLANSYIRFFLMPTQDTIFLDLEKKINFYKENHFLYKLNKLVLDSIPQNEIKLNVLSEISKLYETGKNRNYLEFFCFYTVLGQLISFDELIQYIPNFNFTSNWGSQLLSLEKTKKNNISLIDSIINEKSLIILKFWASWCKPCIKDDIKIDKLRKKGKFNKDIIGIQTDDVELNTNYLMNLRDPHQTITHKFEVNSFPTYILFYNQKIILKTNSFDELFQILKKKKYVTNSQTITN